MSNTKFYVQKRENGCEPDSGRWYLTIYTCDNGVLEWCGKKYLALPMKCGFLELDIPAGCYQAVAVWGFSASSAGVWGNHWTHRVIFQAPCEGTNCIKLWNPSLHSCGWLYHQAVIEAAENNPNLPKDLVQNFVKTNDALMAAIPVKSTAYEVNNFDEFKRAVIAAEKSITATP